MIFRRRKQSRKIFCIGHNKTGTTSLTKAFLDFGFSVGNQDKAERLIYYYRDRKFGEIVKHCNTATVFQDVPFSLPYTFVHLDQMFPNSKFILTVRNSAEDWYNSKIRFQSKRYGVNGEVPTYEDLMAATYKWKGFPYETKKIIYNTDDQDLYNKEKLIKFYNDYNASVIEYFRYRMNDLLVLNLNEDGSYIKFCDFIGMKPKYENFPWLNATKK